MIDQANDHKHMMKYWREAEKSVNKKIKNGWKSLRVQKDFNWL